VTHARERSLTLLVIVEAIQLFVIVPLSAETGVTFAVFVAIVVTNIVVALAVVWHLRVAVVAVLVASAIEAVAVVLRIARPSHGTATLDAAAALVLLVTLTVVLSLVVFGPGRVTVHRILGAVAIYLNVAAAFGVAYRMIDALGPGRFTALHSMHDGHTLADLVYFSFTTLTTTGFGDILPVDPFARSLSNLESVIGQLFPATLLARLITLEIEHRRDLPD
jgi:hypothetical protein